MHSLFDLIYDHQRLSAQQRGGARLASGDQALLAGLEQLLRGYGWTPWFVEGCEPTLMHQAMASALDGCLDEIRRILAQLGLVDPTDDGRERHALPFTHNTRSILPRARRRVLDRGRGHDQAATLFLTSVVASRMSRAEPFRLPVWILRMKLGISMPVGQAWTQGAS